MTYTDRGYGFGGMLTPMVKRLLIANVAVYAVMLLGGGTVRAVLIDWFAFHPGMGIFLRPWGVVTYMFLHADLLHLAVNMLVIFFFGGPLESRWGSSEFLRYYLLCGIGGVVLSFLFMPATVLGASAAAYGLMMAFAMNWPDAPIYVWGIFPVKAKWLVAFLAVLSLLNALGMEPGAGGGVAHFAHLGGLAAGFVYLKTGGSWGRRTAAPRKSARSKPRRLAIVPREERAARSAGRKKAREREEDRALLDAVDQVLDKISASGMASLTDDELKLLDEMSKRHRSN